MSESPYVHSAAEGVVESSMGLYSVPAYVSFLQQNRTREQALAIYEQRIADALAIYTEFSHAFVERCCPCCGAQERADLEPFQGIYRVAKCMRCTTAYVTPCPPPAVLGHYYSQCRCNGMLGDLLKARQRSGDRIISDRVRFLLTLIDEYLLGRARIRILEVGCNSGGLLSELKAALHASDLLHRCELTGIDIDASAIARNEDRDLTLHAASAEEFAAGSGGVFDLIIHFELIEHLFDPHGFMVATKKLMSDGGLHHFHTPNALGMDNQALGYNSFRALAHGIFPPMHLQAFTPQNIGHFAMRSGYSIVQMDTPGNFDVDMVANWLPKDVMDSPFIHIHQLPREHLAIFQQWLKVLGASSHMRCTLRS